MEAWITLENKKQVHEFQHEVDEESGVATCWISGEPGQVSFNLSFPSFRAVRRRECVWGKNPIFVKTTIDKFLPPLSSTFLI